MVQKANIAITQYYLRVISVIDLVKYFDSGHAVVGIANRKVIFSNDDTLNYFLESYS